MNRESLSFSAQSVKHEQIKFESLLEISQHSHISTSNDRFQAYIFHRLEKKEKKKIRGDEPLPPSQVELKWVDIQSSCTPRELVVTGDRMFWSARVSTGNAVEPATAKSTPCLKSAPVFL